MTCVLQGMAPKSCRMQFNSCLPSFQVWILCNDCGASNEVMYHIVAHKCTSCSSYNTRLTRGPLNSGSSSSSSSSSEWEFFFDSSILFFHPPHLQQFTNRRIFCACNPPHHTSTKKTLGSEWGRGGHNLPLASLPSIIRDIFDKKLRMQSFL
jgi:hypothetical protein